MVLGRHHRRPPCTQILNDMDTCRQRLWKKAFIGVAVSTLPMNRNTRPPGPLPPPLPYIPPPPHPVPRTLEMEDNVGWGPRPCLRYSHCSLPPCLCSAFFPPPQVLGGVVWGGCLWRVSWESELVTRQLGLGSGCQCEASVPHFA